MAPPLPGPESSQAPGVEPVPAAPDAEADSRALVVHEDALDAACQAASRSIDQLIWQGSAEVAKSVTLFGPGIVVLPLFGRVSGVPEHKCLGYASHPKRAARGGLMDRVDLESKFGLLSPGRLVEELAGGRPGLERRLQAMGDQELHDEVVALQDWREKANGRLRTLERRAAWAFLGIPPGTASQAAVKRAFKKRALELHPDKGGDAERFQLLQQMKELLIVPTPKELEELEREAKEREAEADKARQQEKEKERQKEGEGKAGEEDEDGDFSGFSSDSSYDVDEELRKMFPDKSRKKRRREQPEDADGDLDLGAREHFNRERHEAARRKLHRGFVEMWERAGKLAAEICRAQGASGGEALRQLRRFVDRFANLEVSKLQEDDPRKAERIFRRFLEQGAEVICAAGAVDPLATVSCVAMQVNYPLLAVAHSEDLKQRCDALLEAIKSLPAIFDRYLLPAEDVAVSRARAAKEAAAAAQGKPVALTLLVPDPALTSKRPDGLEIPGVSEVKVELPPGSTLGDLRAAALHVCPGDIFQQIPPRLFCAGHFVGGSDGTALAEVEALKDGSIVQCLPSNRASQPKPHTAGAQAAASMPAPQQAATAPVPEAAAAPGHHAVPQAPSATGEPGAVDSVAAAPAAVPVRPAEAAPTQPTTAAAERPPASSAVPTAPCRTASGEGATSPPEVKPASADHRPSPELLSALGLGKARSEPATSQGGEVAAAAAAAQKSASEEVDRKAGEELHQQRARDERRAAERRAREEVERKAAEDEAEEEDPWFDDFFSDAKKAADANAEKQQKQEDARAAADRAEKQKQQEAADRQREQEKAERRAAQEAGKSAMDARLRAQKQAQEAKKKLEKEKKRLEKEKEKEKAKERSEAGAPQQAGEGPRPGAVERKAPAVSQVRELVKAKADEPCLTVSRKRASWDLSWEHPCAGERKPDGTAVWCYVCNEWIPMVEPFNHMGFELHCEKVGHYGWID